MTLGPVGLVNACILHVVLNYGMSVVGLGFEFGFLCVFSLGFCEFCCPYQCNQLPGNTRHPNDLLSCVEWDAKHYTQLTDEACQLVKDNEWKKACTRNSTTV